MADNAENIPTTFTEEAVIERDAVPVGLVLPSWLSNFKIQAMTVAVLSLVFYLNTFQNGFVFDDNMVILRNSYVLRGIAGIPDILTKDTYDSYYKQNKSDNVLGGGRYRPLSVITFAIEQQFLGAYGAEQADSLAGVAPSFTMNSAHEQRLLRDSHIMHLFNVLWFTLSVVVLLYFLRYVVLRNSPLIALLATIIFTIHPIHTEVVANIKSRDEILSLLFICLTFICAFKYREQRKKIFLGLALACYFLAFLSKEYAITLLVLLPLSFYLLGGDTPEKSLVALLPYVAIAVLYLALRFAVVPPFNKTVDHSIENNAYAYAAGGQKSATKIATSLNYLKLLVFPHPLSSDYSYNAIPYKGYSHPLVWLSLMVHGLLVAGFFYFLDKRKVLSFAIAFYFLNLLLINNILYYIGATMGERLIYHASVGFAVAVAYLLYHGVSMIKTESAQRIALLGMMAIVIALCGFKTIQRNAEWKSNFTLASHDINVVPNSFLMNGNIAINYLNKSDAEQDKKEGEADVRRAIAYFSKALAINNIFVQGYVYRGGAYFRLKEIDSALADLNKIKQLSPGFPGMGELYYNIGVAFYKNKQYEQALNAWQQALQVRPDYTKAQNSINILYNYNLVQKKESSVLQ